MLSTKETLKLVWEGDAHKIAQNRSSIYLNKWIGVLMGSISWLVLVVLDMVVTSRYHASSIFNKPSDYTGGISLWVILLFTSTYYHSKHKGTLSFFVCYCCSYLLQQRISVRTGMLTPLYHLFFHRTVQFLLLVSVISGPFYGELREFSTTLMIPIVSSQLSLINIILRRLIILYPTEVSTIASYEEGIFFIALVFFYSLIKAQYAQNLSENGYTKSLWEVCGLVFIPLSASTFLNWTLSFIDSGPSKGLNPETFFEILTQAILITLLTFLSKFLPTSLFRKPTFKVILCIAVVISEVLLLTSSFRRERIFPFVNINKLPCPTEAFCPKQSLQETILLKCFL